MAESPFPNPRTTEYNPSAWDNNIPLTEDEIDYLNNNFVTFPIAQPNVTFPVAPTVPTLPIGTGDTRAASAQFVQNAKNTQTWGALQTFSAGMVTSTINPTTAGGTLLIGNGSATNNIEIASVASRSTVLHLGDGNNSTGAIQIGTGTSSSNNVQILNGTSSTGTITLGSATSTTSLGCPLTANYTYPIAVGKIGRVIDVAFVGGASAVANTSTTDNPQTQGTLVTLPIGVWIISGNAGRGGYTGYLSVALTTTTNSYTGTIARDTMVTSVTNNAVNNFSVVVYNTAVQDYFLVAEGPGGGTWLPASFSFRAVRIA
jgi:hypothetical protein